MTWLFIVAFILMIFMAIEPYILWILLFIVLFFVIIVISVERDIAQDSKIVSAEVVSRTQIMKETYQHSGFSVGTRGNPRFHWRVKNVPDHIEVKLNVVYEDGKQRQLTLVEGSDRHQKIMSICSKRQEKITAKVVPPQNNLIQTTTKEQLHSTTNHRRIQQPKKVESSVEYIDIKTNQLVAGVYVIGEAIPEGTYDFRWVWGNGCVKKYADHTTSRGSNLFIWVGNTHTYESQVIVNAICKSGEYLRIEGNLIVEIRKSKPVEIDL